MSGMTLSEFLLARIAEDEAAARQAEWGTPWSANGSTVYETTATPHGEVVADECWSRSIASHIACHDPTRVLAECEAKRRIVATCDKESLDNSFADPTAYRLADDTLRALALPYADHPDYREEWKP